MRTFSNASDHLVQKRGLLLGKERKTSIKMLTDIPFEEHIFLVSLFLRLVNDVLQVTNCTMNKKFCKAPKFL